ncbi:MAG: circularly permuted type 2 ATP-grasp protein [Planctomycetales bacterium]
MIDSSGPEGALPPGSPNLVYRPRDAAQDEMLAPDLTVRPAWTRFSAGLAQLGTAGLDARADQVDRLLRENGVTYNVYGAAQDLDRPWLLDPLPLLIPEADWSRLAAGIEQRLELLNRLAQDVYGPQRLLRDGALPAQFLYKHAGFLRPCVGIEPPGGVFLHWYAAQLARDATGQWIVLGDRTQGPSGAGYAVENRIVVSRTLPQDFHSLNVLRLAPYFVTLKRTLARLAGELSDNPRIVLLSPGPRSSRYFEDVYLARYLGYALVEGGDLTVRGDGVFLKTLGGLLPVHVILRRMGDQDCDPLDLRPDSLSGVPALVQAARSGRVVIANALGSGILEAPIVQALLPGLCRHILGEGLRLASVPTWWCGRASDLAYVEAHLSELIVRSAFQQRGRARPGWQLSNAERGELLARIRAKPARYVAQMPVVGSTAPVWVDGRLQPWHVTLRTFAVFDRPRYQVMPGGLCRVAPDSELLAESMAAGQRSKDLWILSDKPVESVTLLRDNVPALQLRRSTNDLPSRAADHLFWLGRLTERAESLVRQIRSIVARMTTEVRPAGLAEMRLLVESLCEPGRSPLCTVSGDDRALWEQIRSELWSVLRDRQRSGSLSETLESARRTASVVRDRIAIDSWRVLHQMHLAPADSPDAKEPARVLLELNHLLILLSAFSGLGAESMTRGPGWLFLDLGRRIERAQQTLRLVRGLLVDASTELLPRLEAMLEIADSSMTYRYRYLATLQLAPVLDLILVDDSNPRAVIYQFVALADHARSLSLTAPRGEESPQARLARKLLSDLRLADIEALCQVDGASDRETLAQRLDAWSESLRSLSDSISHTYLSHTTASRQLTQLLVPTRK